MSASEPGPCLYGGGCTPYYRDRAPCVNCHPPHTVGQVMLKSKRVLVCGGRDFFHEQFLKEQLNDMLWQRGRFAGLPDQPDTLITGMARGADTMAFMFALGCGLKTMEFPADWARHRLSAGPIRNRQMLVEGKPDFIVAFPGGNGTADMIRQARRAGLPIIQFTEKDLLR